MRLRRGLEYYFLWLYYAIPFDFNLFRHYFGITCKCFIIHLYFVWHRTTNKDSIPRMRIWSILLLAIHPGLKWCVHLGRSLFFVLGTVHLIFRGGGGGLGVLVRAENFFSDKIGARLFFFSPALRTGLFFS